MIDALLLDIEGTLASQRFVARELWAYSRAHMAAFVAAHGEEPAVAALLAETRALGGGDDAVAILRGWIDEDRKAPPLKAIQGLMWSDGFASGALRGHVFADAAAALRRWQAAGVPAWVFSSGTVRTQREFFAHTPEGDLTGLFRGHFDTAMGAKVETESYRRIAQRIGAAPARLLFVSDNPRELEAAQAAGLRVTQMVREDTLPDERFAQVASFDQILLHE